jgi:hypothetical protein
MFPPSLRGHLLFFLNGLKFFNGSFNSFQASFEFLAWLRSVSSLSWGNSAYGGVYFINPGGLGFTGLQSNGYPILQKGREFCIADQDRNYPLFGIGPSTLEGHLQFQILPPSNTILWRTERPKSVSTADWMAWMLPPS